MRPEALRDTAAKAARSKNKLKGRLSKGEKRDRRRMAEVGAVYTIEPVPRTPDEVMAHRHDGPPKEAPKATDKWLTASVVDDAASVIASVFDEAERRDPDHSHFWVDLMHRTITIVEQRQQLRDGTVVTGPPKTEAGVRTLAIPESLMAEVESHLERFVPADPQSLLFYGEKGGRLGVHVFQSKWDAAQSSLDLEHTHFHDLRHVANILTAASGASTKELMYRMGHASPAAALQYQHATRDRDAAIAAVLSDLVADPKAPVVEIRTPPRAVGG